MASARSVPISHPWRERDIDRDFKNWESEMDKRLEEDRKAFQARVDDMDREFKRKFEDRDFNRIETRFERHPAPYWRRAQEIKDVEQRARAGSFGREAAEMRDLRDRFELALDVKDYAPEDIKVTVHNNELKVEGKHIEEKDNDGYKSKKVHEFSRKYQLPSNVNPERITSTLQGDGMLTIEAPKFAIEGGRKIPVTYEKSG